MSYTSILFACSNNICSWSADAVIHVLLQGHILHTNQLNFYSQEFPRFRSSPCHWWNTQNHSHGQYQLFHISEFCEWVYKHFALERYKDGFLVRLSDYTTAIINHDDNYHLFDSHARGTNGFPDQPWKAVAVYFPNSVSVCRHFQQFGDCCNIMAEQQIEVFPVQLIDKCLLMKSTLTCLHMSLLAMIVVLHHFWNQKLGQNSVSSREKNHQ